MELGFLLGSIVKIIGILAYLYGLLWVLARPNRWVKIIGVIVAFGVIQLALTNIGGFQLLTNFDSGLLFQACAMTMVALVLNLIYGFNGQFSLGQWGFYGIGAYTAADITYRWVNGDARGLLVVGFGTILGGLALIYIGRWLKRFRGVPVLSSFTLYLIGAILAGIVAVYIGNALNPLFEPLLGTNLNPGVLNSPLALQIVFFLAVVFAGIFAAEVSFLFGLPVLFWYCDTRVYDCGQCAHDQLGYHSAFPRNERRTRYGRYSKADHLVLGIFLYDGSHYHYAQPDSIQHGAGDNFCAGG
jgi:branched-chain amino acid transport system permease protein